jgi:hypothetical protein
MAEAGPLPPGRSADDASTSSSIAALPSVAEGPAAGRRRASLAGALLLRLAEAGSGSWSVDVVLARGASTGEALRRLDAGLRSAGRALAGKIRADHRFWRGAARLEGDWPPAWRRGWVYDVETLRMVVREPIGIYRGVWDGMQVQVPRLVLAEAAMDALALSYVDPYLAKAVLANTFRDAIAPNVPCTREDGSVNMVSADGAECGTAPSWGHPVYCAYLMERRLGDRGWLAEVYPRLSTYLAWWLRHRSDGQGWLHYRCGWESGQDETPRFGERHHGGSPVDHLRPVELHASVAQGARLLSAMAATLGLDREVRRWSEVAEEYTARTRALWWAEERRFADWDARAGCWVRHADPMQLAPAMAQVATEEQREPLVAFGRALPPHAGAWPPLAWPPVAWTVFEALWALGEGAAVGEMVADLLDRVYQHLDARDPRRPQPGVAAEYWPAEGRGGTEGYGWGAFGLVFLVRYLLGLREPPPDDPCSLLIVPNLPRWLLRQGGRWGLRRLPLLDGRLDVHLARAGDGTLAASLAWSGPDGRELRVETPDGAVWEGDGRVAFPARIGATYRLTVRSAREPSASTAGAFS